MSDFLDTDINELLHGDDKKDENSDDKAYKALLEQDRKLIKGFVLRRDELRWPDPVRKRHLR